MKNVTTTAWQQYEAGKEYKQSIGLYEAVRQNRRFYGGDQWHGVSGDLPKPVFNIVRRITDYLVSSVFPGDISIAYADERIPFLESAALRESVSKGIDLLNQNAAYRWKRDGMEQLARHVLLDAALTGDGVFYCWWDHTKGDGQLFEGDIRTDRVENTNLFVADVNSCDLQAQDYVILAGRQTVRSLRREAIEAGLSEAEAARIVGDRESEMQPRDPGYGELKGEEKATCLIRFYREDGEVVFEKSTRDCILRRVHTGLRYYPVAYFNWHHNQGSFHGDAPAGDLIANQKFINTAYAMAMKHMRDTAFSKVVYDKSRIPEWSNGVGEAIAAMGGGSVADAISVVGVGKMQDGYLDLLNNVVEQTKNMMGATEAALGDAAANNTSAILTLQNASRLALAGVVSNFTRCLGELALIWADMICTYCPEERFLPVSSSEGVAVGRSDYRMLGKEVLIATVSVGQTDRYTPAATMALLNRLLEGGHIDVEQYLELLPEGTLLDRAGVLKTVRKKGALRNE